MKYAQKFLKTTEHLAGQAHPYVDDARIAIQEQLANETELLTALELAARYLSHPDVLAITRNMALPGNAINECLAALIAKAKGE